MFLVRKNSGHDAGQLYAMKVSLKVPSMFGLVDPEGVLNWPLISQGLKGQTTDSGEKKAPTPKCSIVKTDLQLVQLNFVKKKKKSVTLVPRQTVLY